MKSLYRNHFWKLVGTGAILLQTLFTFTHLKLFPFSDHGVFEAPRKIQGQRFYRFITKDSYPHYEEEGILYEKSFKLKSLLEYSNLSPQIAVTKFNQDVLAIDRFTLGNSSAPPLFNKERIYQK